MAGTLGLDLDLHELRLAELVSSSGGYQLHAALALPTGTTDPVKLGEQLKTKLKEIGFKANTVVIALSSDSLTCREVRHPDIPPNELPAIVQFQVLKEVALPADDTIVDYIPLAQPYSTGEKRSLTYVVRKARVEFCEKLCEAAGLKLQAIVPRAVALFSTIKSQAESSQATGYACSNSFFVVHNGELIFNHSLGSPHDGPELIRELRRSIAGYSNQANMPELQSVFLAGHELPDEVQQHLESFLVPVKLYDPYLGIQGAERLLGHGDYAVACGAAQALKVFKKPPVEFLSPKKVIVKPNRTRSYAIIGGLVAASLALLTWGLYWMMTSSTDAEIAELQESVRQKQDVVKNATDVEKRFEAIKAWKEQEFYVLEEIYTLIETFPDIAGVQIVKAEWKAIAPPQTPTSTILPASKYSTSTSSKISASPPKTTPVKPVARLSLKATATTEDQLKTLKTALRSNTHWKYLKDDLVPQERNTVIYELEIPPMKPEDYKSVIALGNNVTSTETSTSNRPGTRRGFRPTGGGRP